MTDVVKNLESAITAMNSNENFFDVTIICTTDDHQAEYWMDCLSSGIIGAASRSKKGTNGDANKEDETPTKQQKLSFPIVLAVSEDWNDSGGAGNGLGTLYAFQKAHKLALEKYQLDLEKKLLEKEISAALYHTAGKGTRLAPLPASENNNKPGVKLPFCHQTGDDKYEPLSVLEAVVKQTGIYASSRKGRLSVFWGDQVFIPSADFKYTPTHHVDILCTLLGSKAPTAEEWTEQGLEKYGVIAVIEGDDDKTEAAQVEKVSHETATSMLTKLGKIGAVGPSLGSFSVSGEILQLLCDEFKDELTKKEGKLDTDPHFWMPLTLSKQDYLTLMKQKGVEEDESSKHFDRMEKMKTKAKEEKNDSKLGLFGAVDVGKDASWWDYGQLKLYSKNSLLLLGGGDKDGGDGGRDEAALLRKFLGFGDDTPKVLDSSKVSSSDDIKVDDTSYVFSTTASKGNIANSVVSSCRAIEMELDGAIVVNCTAKKIKAGKGSILYNVTSEDDDGITVGDGEVVVNVTDENGKSFSLKSRMDIDGGKAWKEKLDMNEFSFEDVHKNNKNANIMEISKKRKEHADKVATSFLES